MKWISTAGLLLILGFGWTIGEAMAQQGGMAQSFDEFSARLEQQDRQIQPPPFQPPQIQAPPFQPPQTQSPGMQQGADATPAGYVPWGGTAAGPANTAQATAGGYQIGGETSVTVRFKDGLYLWLETPNKDFTMHLGGWMQWDNVWWNQSLGMSAPQGKASPGVSGSPGAGYLGIGSGGIGSLQDGDDWRRVRIVMEGTFWQTFEYRWNYALENDQYSSLGLDEFWLGDNNLPLIGTVRVGHVKNPIGLEGDMTSSSRAMTFMERSAYSEAIELNQNFVDGVWFSNTYLDDRLFWAASAFRPDNGNSGDFYGTGQWGMQGRITGLPLYEDDGRHLLHLGISGGWRNGSNNLASSTGYYGNTVTLSARPELRDDDPAAGASGSQTLNDANDNRMVSTGPLACDREYLMGLEMLYIRGPFSVQAEYGWNFLIDAQGILSTSSTAALSLKNASDYTFGGGYVQVAYTLTGENRAYDKKAGGLSRFYLGNQGPYERAFLVRDEGGNLFAGHGAWEIAARYTYLDLNAGSGATAVNGGIMEGFSLGLNWFLNTNLTVNTEWVYNNRYDVPSATTAGSTTGLGTRVQVSF